jgi:hypothetical protein
MTEDGTLIVGQTARLSAVPRDVDGNLVIPSGATPAIVLYVLLPGATDSIDLTSGLQEDGGEWSAELVLTVHGRHRFRWATFGDVVSAREGMFTVMPRRVPDPI